MLTEDRLVQDSYKKGFEIGQSETNVEAFHLGYHRGAEIGAEIGYYIGVTETYLKYYSTDLDSQPEKNLKALESLKQLLTIFPNHNDPNVDLAELLSNIRAKFKKICSLLKVDEPLFPESSKITF